MNILGVIFKDKTSEVFTHPSLSIWLCPLFSVSTRLIISPFQANVLFLYSLIMSENQRFAHIFRGYRNETLA